METYARHVVYRGWPGGKLRPHLSFDTLRDAIKYVDDVRAAEGWPKEMERVPDYEYEVIDLEHLHLGDMLTATAAARTVARLRASMGAPT